MVWARVVGTALQLFGLGLAAYGVSETRQTYAPDRPGIAGTVKRSVRPWYVRLRRWLGRPVPGRVVEAHAASLILMGGTARMEVTHNPLPATMTTADRLDALDLRTRSHREELNRLGRAVVDEQEAREADVKRLDTAVSGETEQRRREIATAMAGGLRLESWGLGTAAVGTLFAAFG